MVAAHWTVAVIVADGERLVDGGDDDDLVDVCWTACIARDAADSGLVERPLLQLLLLVPVVAAAAVAVAFARVADVIVVVELLVVVAAAADYVEDCSRGASV